MKKLKIAITCIAMSSIILGTNNHINKKNNKILFNNYEALTSGDDQDWVWFKTETKDDIVEQSISSITKAGGITVNVDSANTYSFTVGSNNTQTYNDDADIRCVKYYCGGVGLRCDDTNSGILTINIHTGRQIFIPKSKFKEGFNNM